MKCRISRSLLDRIGAETRAYPHLESCGLLLGTGDRIHAAVPGTNVAANPARSFEIATEEVIAARRAARASGLRLVGHYHFHPSGCTAPSPADAAGSAEEGVWWLIVTAANHALWVSRGDGSIADAFDRVPLAIIEPPPCKLDRQGPIGQLREGRHDRGTEGNEIVRIRKPPLLASVS